ncbi:unnamed protein product [Caenorhabditis brenneri]
MRILLLCVALLSIVSAGKQSARVVGRLMCRGKPQQYAELRLVSHRFIKGDKILADDVFSDSDGYFDISGSTTQITNMDVRLTIWHDCFEDERPRGGCKNWLELQIPSLYVNKGPFPMTFLEMGNLDLEKEQKKEHLDKCGG